MRRWFIEEYDLVSIVPGSLRRCTLCFGLGEDWRERLLGQLRVALALIRHDPGRCVWQAPRNLRALIEVGVDDLRVDVCSTDGAAAVIVQKLVEWERQVDHCRNIPTHHFTGGR